MTAANYHSGRQIPVEARMFTSRGWMTGTLRTVAGQTMMDFIEHSHRFITFTAVQIAGYDQAIDYLSFQREAIGVMLPPDGQEWRARPPGNEGQFKTVRVLLLFEQGAVRGCLEIPARVRVSDFFMNRDGFVQVTQSHVRLPDPQGQRTNELHALALVNTSHVVGVSELPSKR